SEAGANDTHIDTYDGNGNVSTRTWRDGANQLIRQQTLTWDAVGLLIKVSERDAAGNGRDWAAVFDPLGRKERTTTTMYLANVAQSASASVINSWFDPQVEFLEFGIDNNGQRTWAVRGPDLNGRFGAMTGVGGSEVV